MLRNALMLKSISVFFLLLLFEILTLAPLLSFVSFDELSFVSVLRTNDGCLCEHH